ncbi:MAG: hypothetical protein Q9198_010634, partial [Flavoplaca austrocitrina]
LENAFHKEGYDLGIQDGNRTGRIEGRLFGLTSAFEKFSTMGTLHGRSVIWSARLSAPPLRSEQEESANDRGALATNGHSIGSRKSHKEAGPAGTSSSRTSSSSLPREPHNSRLQKHIRTVYALTEPASISTDNTEEAVSDFNDRLKRAEGKAKIIEKSFDEESSSHGIRHPDSHLQMDFTSSHPKAARGDRGIRDDAGPV